MRKAASGNGNILISHAHLAGLLSRAEHAALGKDKEERGPFKPGSREAALWPTAKHLADKCRHVMESGEFLHELQDDFRDIQDQANQGQITQAEAAWIMKVADILCRTPKGSTPLLPRLPAQVPRSPWIVRTPVLTPSRPAAALVPSPAPPPGAAMVHGAAYGPPQGAAAPTPLAPPPPPGALVSVYSPPPSVDTGARIPGTAPGVVPTSWTPGRAPSWVFGLPVAATGAVASTGTPYAGSGVSMIGVIR